PDPAPYRNSTKISRSGVSHPPRVVIVICVYPSPLLSLSLSLSLSHTHTGPLTSRAAALSCRGDVGGAYSSTQANRGSSSS
ncbi:hypothetical protein TSAR_002937, partial [Trichomalopsis sarcophagae]